MSGLVPGTPGPQLHRALAVGNFDGVHLGHRAIIARLVQRAGSDLVPTVVTFDPHPRRVLDPARAPALLTAIEERVRLLKGAGATEVVAVPFDLSLASLAPEAFVREWLVGHLGGRAVVVGEGFRFGHLGAGNVELLRRLGTAWGFTVDAVAPVCVDGEPVSSSRIREHLFAGEVERAARLLGRPYALAGPVVEGRHRGRTLGFPTANVRWDPRLVLPAPGVYVVEADFGQGPRLALASIGSRPTFGESDVTLEVYVVDFSQDLYGRRLEVAFHDFVRPEERFVDAAALVRRMHEDVDVARRLFARGFSTRA